MKNKILALFMSTALTAGSVLGLTACDMFGGQSDSGSSAGNSSNNSGSTANGGDSPSTNKPQETYNGTPQPVSLSVRTNTVTITDAGRDKQQMDRVCFSDYYKASALYNSGYTKLKVTINIDVREVDDGYQYIFLYYNTECKGNNFFDKLVDIFYDEDPSLLHFWKFEHGPGVTQTAWETYTFTTSIQMNKIKDDLFIRYGASGHDSDNWQNKNVSVVLEPIKV